MQKKDKNVASFKREKSIRVLAIMALVLAILTLTISYAAMSKNTQIIKLIEEGNGYSDTSPSDKKDDKGNKEKTTTKRDSIINNDNEDKSSIEVNNNFDVGFYNLKKKYVSDGVKINSEPHISFINKYISVCDKDSNPTENEKLVCDGIQYEIYYTENNNLLELGDTLNVGESKNITIKIMYDSEKLPTSLVNISDLHYLIIYTQTQ